jgi:hypothetical protein
VPGEVCSSRMPDLIQGSQPGDDAVPTREILGSLLQTVDSQGVGTSIPNSQSNLVGRRVDSALGAHATDACAPGSLNARHVGVRRTTPQSTLYPPPIWTKRAPGPRARRVEQGRSSRAVGRSVAAIAAQEQPCLRLHE